LLIAAAWAFDAQKPAFGFWNKIFNIQALHEKTFFALKKTFAEALLSTKTFF